MQHDDERRTRREVLGGLGLGIATVSVVAPAFAADEPRTGGTQAASPKSPTNLYPRPPFERQPQEPPGLASRMKPRPDHGEKSYRGSGKLIGRKALITG